MKEFKPITEKELKTNGVVSLADRPNAFSRYGSGGMTAQQLKEAFDKLSKLLADRLNDLFKSLGDGTEEGNFTGAVNLPEELMGEGTLYDFLGWFAAGQIANKMFAYNPTTFKSDTLNNCLKALHDEAQDNLEYGKKEFASSVKIVYSEKHDAYLLSLWSENGLGTSAAVKIGIAKGNLDNSVTEYVEDLVDSKCHIVTEHVGDLIDEKCDDLGSRIAYETQTRIIEHASIKGNTVESITYDAQTGVLSFIPMSGEAAAKRVDLPLELMVKSGYYDAENNKLVLELTNPEAAPIEIPVDDLIREVISMPTAAAADVGKVAVVTGENAYELREPICGFKPKPSEGLEYALSDDGLSYAINGMGKCADVDLVIPSTYEGLPVTSIGEAAFANHENLRSVTFNSLVPPEFAGTNTFAGCPLEAIYVPAGAVDTYKAVENLAEHIGIFKHIETLNTLKAEIGEIKRVVAEIDTLIDDVVGDNSPLQEQVDNILSGYPCSEGLEYAPHTSTAYSADTYYVAGIGTCTDVDLVIPSVYNGGAVDSIHANAFFENQTIKSVVIPDNVASIEGYAFMGCESLEKVTIGKNVDYLYYLVFANCPLLKKVVFLGKPNRIQDLFSDNNNLTDIYVPWSEGEIEGAPWGAPDTCTIHYNHNEPPTLGGLQSQIDLFEKEQKSIGGNVLSMSMNMMYMTQNITGLRSELDRGVGKSYSLGTSDFYIAGVYTNIENGFFENNFIEVSLVFLNTQTNRFETHSANLFYWNGIVPTVDILATITDGKFFSIPVTLAHNNIGIFMSQIKVLNGSYVYAGTGVVTAKTKFLETDHA